MKSPRRGRSLTDEEKRLWAHITQADAPLSGNAQRIDEAAQRVAERPIVQRDTYGTPLSSQLFFAVTNARPLTSGGYAGIDRNTAERFRKGEMQVEGTLDLHGMTREKAHIALNGFIRAHYDRGSRCLLAITGKGLRNEDSHDPIMGGGRGVLREMVPQWLGEPALRPLVLAFDSATPKHGGGGAYYILLRRSRN